MPRPNTPQPLSAAQVEARKAGAVPTVSTDLFKEAMKDDDRISLVTALRAHSMSLEVILNAHQAFLAKWLADFSEALDKKTGA
jgi:hypothetical protein